MPLTTIQQHKLSTNNKLIAPPTTPKLKTPSVAAGQYFVENAAARNAFVTKQQEIPQQQRRNTTGPVLEALQLFQQQQNLQQLQSNNFPRRNQRPMSLRNPAAVPNRTTTKTNEITTKIIDSLGNPFLQSNIPSKTASTVSNKTPQQQQYSALFGYQEEK